MIGLIPKVLTDLIIEQAGEDTLKRIFKQANLPTDKTYQMNQYYSDEEWRTLYETTLTILKINEEQATKLYAEQFCQFATQTFPTWFKMAKNSREFLLLQPNIHNSFSSALVNPEQRQQINDKFFVEATENEVITHYKSPNQLCQLYIALGNWIINYYGDKAEISETKCLKRGDDKCEIHVKWL